MREAMMTAIKSFPELGAAGAGKATAAAFPDGQCKGRARARASALSHTNE